MVIFLLSCAVFSAGGWWLGRAAPRAQVTAQAPIAGTAGKTGMPAAPGRRTDGSDGKDSVQFVTTTELKRKIAAQADTAELWRWCLAREDRDSSHQEIFAELVDRLGWAAWDQALALEDPRQRSLAAESMLEELAKRDPWRAFETWRDHWQELLLPGEKHWGGMAMINAMNGLSQASAPQMIGMIQALSVLGRWDVKLMPEYPADFDFAAVAEFLNQPSPEQPEDKLPPIRSDESSFQPGNLLEEWGRHSPVAMSQWLLEHAQLSTDNEPWQWQSQADRALHQIAGQSADTPGRAEALEILSRLPAQYLEDSWRSYVQESRNVLSLSELEAATQMNQREAYLSGAFSGVPDRDEIDPSWAQLPVQDRQPLLEKMEKQRDEGGSPGPLQQAAWDRWFRRMKAVWGME